MPEIDQIRLLTFKYAREITNRSILRLEGASQQITAMDSWNINSDYRDNSCP
jgi:uncharacterized protein YbaP (TraB family)